MSGRQKTPSNLTDGPNNGKVNPRLYFRSRRSYFIKYISTKKFFIYISVIIFANFSTRADDEVKHEIQIKVDNNFFVPLINTDKYYTYGQKFFNRKRIDYTNGISLSLESFLHFTGSKKIIEFETGQNAYTPGNLKNNNFKEFDRPFAGWLNTGYNTSFITDHKILKSYIQLPYDFYSFQRRNLTFISFIHIARLRIMSCGILIHFINHNYIEIGSGPFHYNSFVNL